MERSDGAFRGSRSAANINTSRGRREPSPVTCHGTRQLPESRERELLQQLLVQIMDFVARKQQTAKRQRAAPAAAASPSGSAALDWRSDARRSKHGSDDLFDVVIRVCERRMQRLHDDARDGSDVDEWPRGQTPPRVLVAEAMVQELLVSLMAIQLSEKEELILDEVDTVEAMRQLHAQLDEDEQAVRHRVCAAAGDEQQLQELQAALRTDFLQEVAHTRATQRLNDSTQHSDASLQFAWETIQEQKKEVVRLRAENQELKARQPVAGSVAAVGQQRDPSRTFDSSLFSDEPVSAIRLLRSQLSAHHDTNLSLLHDYITRLEHALRRATAGDPSARDSSGLTFDSSRGDEKENWHPLFSRSTLARDDFARTQPAGRRSSCEPCKRSSAAAIALQSEAKQLRAQVAADEEALVRAEKDQLHLKRENSALTSALLAAKQQQEELRQMVLDITHDKHESQSQGEAERRASERTIRLLRDQLDGVDEHNRRQARKLERLELERDNEDRKQRSSFSATRRSAPTEDYESAAETNSVLRERIRRLQSEIVELEALASGDKREIGELRATVDALTQDTTHQALRATPTAAQSAELREKEDALEAMKQAQASYEAQLESYRQRYAALESRADSLQRTLAVRDEDMAQRDATIAGLKHDNQVLVSLQKAERERSLFHQDELGKAREECGFLKQRAEAATSDCEKLRGTLQAERAHSESVAERLQEAEGAFKRLKAANATLKCELQDADNQLRSLEDGAAASMQLQSKLEEIKSSHAAQTEELASANERLCQEIADSKTTILMWMSKYNALSEQVRRLEEDVHCASEDRYSLQREIESLTTAYKRQLRDERRRFEAAKAEELTALRASAQAELQQVKQALSSLFESKIAELEKRTREQQLEAQTLQSDLSRSRISNSGELAQLRASTLELESQVSVLKDANRALQYELRSEERQRKTLGLLVQTLQERPVLQRRALHEMLSSSQRQLEFVFVQLLARVEETGRKLLRVDHKCELLRRSRSSWRRFESVTEGAVASSQEPTSVSLTPPDAADRVLEPCARDVRQLIEHLAEKTQCAALLQLARVESDHDAVQRAEVVLVDALCLLNGHRVQQPTTAAVEALVYERRMDEVGTEPLRHDTLLVYDIAAQPREANAPSVSADGATVGGDHQQHESRIQTLAGSWREQLAAATHQWKWQSLARRAEKQLLQKTVRVLALQVLRQYQLSDASTRRRYESKILKLEHEVESLRERAAALSPVSTVALGNCVRLLQKFCDDTETPADIGASRATLTRYLIESNCKIAGWRRTIDRKIEEFSDRKEQLQRLQDRCTEMKELVALNQRLVRELERKAASQQAVVDAACAFTRAYKTLRMSVSSQMFKTNEFYSACKRIVEVVHASSASPGRRASASPSVATAAALVAPVPVVGGSPAPAPVSARRLATLDEESELTTSQAAASSKLVANATAVGGTSARCKSATLARDGSEDVERRRQASRATSEQAVVLLTSANEIRARLERALAERTRALHHALAQLETKRLQFVVLRSFLRWKFAAYALRIQEQRSSVR
ncbi:hypothetical protein PybrP1_009378 [[Pythium] brassicae (nom. inval.)]|nr:hypothetical protein PybrP1_009378 [[Pythium] brassicae (nom. inval.)]